jgi:hypothetical protein
MAIRPTDIRIIFTNYDIITYFLNLASCSEHFISIKHQIFATFDINKKNQFWQPVCLKRKYKASHSIENDSDSVILLLGSAQIPSTV